MDALILKDLATATAAIFKLGSHLKKLKRFSIYYFMPPVKVLIFGISGTGKTQLVNSLLGIHDTRNGRTRLPKISNLELPNGRRVKLFDSPGHDTYVHQREALNDLVRNNKIRGIINVVSYGFCESNVTEDVNVFKNGTFEVKDEYLNQNRQREINQIGEWIRCVDGGKVKWIITLVNKSDIWHRNRTAVLNHYENGSYYDKLKEVITCCNLHVFEYCSLISPFCDKPMLLDVGEKHKHDLQDSFKQELINIISNEGIR